MTQHPLSALVLATGLLLGREACADSTAPPSAERVFEAVRASPPRLRVFLQAMPKGGELHTHLWGVPSAEDFMGWAVEDGLCFDVPTLSLAPPPCAQPGAPAVAGLAARDPALYVTVLDALSLRGQNAGVGTQLRSGHDQFFVTFGRFAPVASHEPGRMLALARSLAAGDHVDYLELQSDPAAVAEAGEAARAGWAAQDFAASEAALAPAIPALLAGARAETDAMEAEAARRLGCVAGQEEAPCEVIVRYQAFALRTGPPATVFGQLALAFALVEADPRYVGVNLVAPEDDPVALADYDLHMAMLRYFASRHPGVPMAPHAGELALGLVPPGAMRDHIAKAIAIPGVRRIGHGVDIAHEADAASVLARMAAARIAVEINLTSNDVILGVRGPEHPLALYRAAGVPFVLSTDDQGVARTDMSREYARAVEEQGLGYADLKAAARASLEYAFLSGASLWQPGAPGRFVAECSAAATGDAHEEPACSGLLARSDKARAQWRLERELAAFEASVGAIPF